MENLRRDGLIRLLRRSSFPEGKVAIQDDFI